METIRDYCDIQKKITTTNGDKMNKITTEQVEMWLGSDCKRSEILEILADLANGDYDQKVLRTDILSVDWIATDNPTIEQRR